jgi:hypothetical protein
MRAEAAGFNATCNSDREGLFPMLSAIGVMNAPVMDTIVKKTAVRAKTFMIIELNCLLLF